MAIGKPLLVGVKGNATEIVEKNDIGITFEPDNINKFTKALHDYSNLNLKKIKKISRNSKKYYENYMSFETGLKKFSEVFISLSKVK